MSFATSGNLPRARRLAQAQQQSDWACVDCVETGWELKSEITAALGLVGHLDDFDGDHATARRWPSDLVTLVEPEERTADGRQYRNPVV
jgi:hypothetical protein